MKTLATLGLLCCAFSVALGQDEKAMILEAGKIFSKAFVAADYEAMVALYTEDAIIMAPARDPIKGKEAIRNYWNSINYRQLNHKLEPADITIVGDVAYDYGFVYSQSESDGVVSQSNSQKYYTIWKKVNGKWLVLVDMWNTRDNNWREKR